MNDHLKLCTEYKKIKSTEDSGKVKPQISSSGANNYSAGAP